MRKGSTLRRSLRTARTAMAEGVDPIVR